MTSAAASMRSGSTLAATSAEEYPSARVSKIAESWRSTPASLADRRAPSTSSSVRPSRSARSANGVAVSGNDHWTALRRSAFGSYRSMTGHCRADRAEPSHRVAGGPLPVAGDGERQRGHAAAGGRRRCRGGRVVEPGGEAHAVLAALHGDPGHGAGLASPELVHERGGVRG